MSRRIKISVEQRAVKRIHNDLGNTAFYLKNRIVDREVAGDVNGISLEIMAALTMTAFWFEACLNFIGSTKIQQWKERDRFDLKMKRVFAHCGIVPDMTSRPFSSISRLKNFRDTLAHGKPQILVYEADEIRVFGDMRHPRYLETEWEKMRTAETTSECYEDVNAIWLQMLDCIGMTELETSSHGSRGLTYKGEVE